MSTFFDLPYCLYTLTSLNNSNMYFCYVSLFKWIFKNQQYVPGSCGSMCVLPKNKDIIVDISNMIIYSIIIVCISIHLYSVHYTIYNYMVILLTWVFSPLQCCILHRSYSTIDCHESPLSFISLLYCYFTFTPSNRIYHSITFMKKILHLIIFMVTLSWFICSSI